MGVFLSPLGWTVAAGLSVLLLSGLGFPWLVARTVVCELKPVNTSLHEHEASHLELRVRNRLPFPILGLMVEGYLTKPLVDSVEIETVPPRDVGLARVPAFSEAVYRLPICPEYRGTYPAKTPKVACAFPFGIWTARRDVARVTRVTVRPLLIPITSEVQFSGSQMAHVGDGDRSASNGDFLGVRDFRRGDSLKSIHWVQSARNDRLIVCERGGPQQQAIEVTLCTVPCDGSSFEIRENLAWRVRIAASLVDMLVSRHLAFKLFIDGQLQQLPIGNASRDKAWTLLSEVPLDVLRDSTLDSMNGFTKPNGANCIVISANSANNQLLPSNQVRVEVRRSSSGVREQARNHSQWIDLDDDIAAQLNQLLLEAAYANNVA